MATQKEKSQGRISKSQDILSEDKIEEILEKINLSAPRNAYTHFCMNEAEKLRSKKENFDFQKFMKGCASSWAKLDDDSRKEYNKFYEEEKKEYKRSLEIVRHYLFKDYNAIIKRPPTAYRIFLNEKLIEGFNKDKDPKQAKIDASEEWKRMSLEEKKIYFDKKKENDDWLEKARNIKKVNPISIFVQKVIQLSKEKNKEVPKLQDIAHKWKELKNSEKNKYRKYAEEINEEREKLRDIYELINGVKPKKPAGAYRIFLQEKAKEKSLHSISEGKQLWDKLTEDQKDEYLKKSHICNLAYKYKKMIYNKKIKKLLPKKPANAFCQFLKEKKGQKVPKGENILAYWRKIYEDLPKDKIKKYEDKAEKAKEKFDKKMEYFKDVVFDIPKKPVNAFSLYLKEMIPKLKQKYKNLEAKDLLKRASDDWQNELIETQIKYAKIAESDRKRFEYEIKQFEKLGYYKKKSLRKNSRAHTGKENMDDNKISTEKKKGTQRTKSKKGSKKTKSQRSQSKTSRKNAPGKSKPKSGKTQRKH